MGRVTSSRNDETTNRAGRSLSGAMLFTLAVLASVAPFGTDLYLSAFPAMMGDLGTTATGVQLSLTAFLVGAGVGQVIFGPWSDKVGRMLPLLSGLVLFLAASVVAFSAGSIELLVVARLLQGLGGSAGMVIGRAMILDRERGQAAAKALSIMMMMIGGVAPVVAPLGGSLLADSIGWRGLLGIVAGLAVFALGTTCMFVRETLPRADREARAQARAGSGDAGSGRAGSGRAGSGRAKSWSTLTSRGYVGNVMAFAFGMAIMMAYISASPFVYQNIMGLSTIQYGLAFAVNALGIVLATGISAKFVGRFTIRDLAGAGLTISLLAVITILLLTMTGASPMWLLVPMFCAIAPLGLVFGNATALALSAVSREATGLASAILGFLQFLLAGIVTGLVGIAGENTALPMALTMLAMAIIAIAGLTFGKENGEGNLKPTATIERPESEKVFSGA